MLQHSLDTSTPRHLRTRSLPPTTFPQVCPRRRHGQDQAVDRRQSSQALFQRHAECNRQVGARFQYHFGILFFGGLEGLGPCCRLIALVSNGCTPLIIAATEVSHNNTTPPPPWRVSIPALPPSNRRSQGRADVVKELISCRADVSIRTPLGDREQPPPTPPPPPTVHHVTRAVMQAQQCIGLLSTATSMLFKHATPNFVNAFT